MDSAVSLRSDMFPSLRVECFARERLGSGVSVIVRALGGYNGAISIRSTKLTLRSHEMTGEMVFGRVSVAVITYEMIPRSNW